MTRPSEIQSPALQLNMSGILFTDSQSLSVSEEEVRHVEEEARSSWERVTDESQLQKSLETMAETLSGDHEEEVDCIQEYEKGDDSDELKGDSTVLIPGLPLDTATRILARVPWKDQPKLMLVCKSWAACMISDSIRSIRAREGLLESFLFTISVPIKLGPLTLTIFEHQVGPLNYDKPLVTFGFLGRWSGFLRGFRCACIGSDLFIIGGRHDGLRYATGKNVWRFNMTSRKWSAVASMNHARRDFACAVIEGRVYIAGGTCSSQVVPLGQGVATALDSAEMYDSEQDKWHVLPNLHRARVGCLGVALEDRFYVIGGGSDHGTVRFEMFRSAEVFDPRTWKWQIIDDMWQSDVQLPRAVADFESSLFAVDSDDQKLKTYDESSNIWRDVMNMPFSAITSLPGKTRSEHVERQQAMGGLPGDYLIQVPCEGLLWVGPRGFLSRASSLLRLEGTEGRGWRGVVGTESCREERARAAEEKIQKKSKLHIIIAAGTIRS